VLAEFTADYESSLSVSVAVAGDAISAHFYVDLGYKVMSLFGRWHYT